MAKLSEKHPREAEIAKQLLEPFRIQTGPHNGAIGVTEERADDLEMKICEALVEARVVARSEV